MTTTDYIIFFAVFAGGIYLFLKAKNAGNSRKEKYEEESIDRLERYLSSLDDADCYQFYTQSGEQGESWVLVDLDTMKAEILEDCMETVPDTFNYRKARFSVTSDQQKKTIYYVVGTNNHRFRI